MARDVQQVSSLKEGRYLFKYVVLAQICAYLEAGAVPAMLVQLASIFSMSHTHQGLLGGIVYLMISLGGLIAGYCFKHYCTRWVLGCSLAANNIATLLFALTPVGRPESAVLLIFYRGLIGFTQAFLCVFCPLWANKFSPPDRRTTWLSQIQGAVPLGVMAGYVLGSVAMAAASLAAEDSLPSGLDSPDFIGATGSLVRDLTSPLEQQLPESELALRGGGGGSGGGGGGGGGSGGGGCGPVMCWRWPFLAQVVLVSPLAFAVLAVVPARHLTLAVAPARRQPPTLPRGAKMETAGAGAGADSVSVSAPANGQRGSAARSQPRCANYGSVSVYGGGSSDCGCGSGGGSGGRVCAGECDGSCEVDSMSDADWRMGSSESGGEICGTSGGSTCGGECACPLIRPLTGTSVVPPSRVRSGSLTLAVSQMVSPEGGGSSAAAVVASVAVAGEAQPGSVRHRSTSLDRSTRPLFAAAPLRADQQMRALATDGRPGASVDPGVVTDAKAGKPSAIEDPGTSIGVCACLRAPAGSSETCAIVECNGAGRGSSGDGDFGEAGEVRGLWADCQELASFDHAVYWLVTVAISALYFVVQGIQYWSTSYLEVVMGGSAAHVNSIFIVTAATAPILGVFFGGWLIDKLGGYKGSVGRARALRSCLCLGAFAAAAADGAVLAPGVSSAVVLVWLTLFFGAAPTERTVGWSSRKRVVLTACRLCLLALSSISLSIGGAVLPPCTGILVSSVPRRLRATASALAVVLYNMLGNFMSPALSGLAMSHAMRSAGCGEVCGLRAGFRLVLGCSNLSLLVLATAWLLALRRRPGRLGGAEEACTR